MNTGYRKLIGWAALATAVILALSVGIAKASPGVPFGGDCDVPLLASSYEPGAPCVPYDICTTDGAGNNTTLWTAAPCTEAERIAQCSAIVEQFQMIPWPCDDLTALFDVCDPDGTRRWSVTPCEYQPPDIGEPQVIDPVLPKTGSTTNTLLALAAALVLLGLVARSCARQMDDGVTL